MIIQYKKWFALVVVVCMVIGWPLAAGASSEPVIIGVPLPLTGDLKEFGLIMKNSLEMAGRIINQAGGVNGSPVELKFADIRGSDHRTVQRLRTSVSVKHRCPVGPE